MGTIKKMIDILKAVGFETHDVGEYSHISPGRGADIGTLRRIIRWMFRRKPDEPRGFYAFGDDSDYPPPPRKDPSWMISTNSLRWKPRADEGMSKPKKRSLFKRLKGGKK